MSEREFRSLEAIALYLSVYSLLDYDLLQIRPSTIAYSVIYVAKRILESYTNKTIKSCNFQ
jgi:hypothetical protein